MLVALLVLALLLGLTVLVLYIGLLVSVGLGHFGISFLELLILFEQWAGHR